MGGITISRQMGSFGTQVAEQVAASLGYRLVVREVINQAARMAGVPEVALATIDELGFLGIKPSKADLEAYHRAVRHVMLDLAKEGNVVIVGRAGQVILKGQPGFLHVRVIAPFEDRVAHVMADKALPRETVFSMVQTSDRYRADYVRKNYHVDVNNLEYYDLMVNTSHLSIHSAAQIIQNAYQNLIES